MSNVKLTDDEIILLRARKARGERVDPKVEADRFGCGVETIRKILRGDTFRHLLALPAVTPDVGPSEEEAAASLQRFLSEVAAKAPLERPDDDVQSLLGNLGGNTPE